MSWGITGYSGRILCQKRLKLSWKLAYALSVAGAYALSVSYDKVRETT